jgi:hypothetical protein
VCIFVWLQDVHTLDLSSFIHDQAKITSFQLIDLNATMAYNGVLKRWHQGAAQGAVKITVSSCKQTLDFLQEGLHFHLT